MDIQRVKELEGQNVFFKNPLGQIQEVTVKRVHLASHMVVYSIKNHDFIDFDEEFFKTSEEAERA